MLLNADRGGQGSMPCIHLQGVSLSLMAIFIRYELVKWSVTFLSFKTVQIVLER